MQALVSLDPSSGVTRRVDLNPTPRPVEERERVLALHQRQVESHLRRFCRDTSHRDCGGLVQSDSGHADTRNSIYDGFELLAAYLMPGGGRYYRDANLLADLRLHMQFIRRRQRDDGTIDMGINGVGLSPEIGFTLPGACAIWKVASESSVDGSDDIASTLEQYIRRGAAALRKYFPLTSNHRWTAHAGPLAVVQRYFPHPDNAAVIEDMLADGIDIDDVGLYVHERSPNYDNVANWGLLYLADFWGRSDLVDRVAKNLNFTLAMIQPNGEAETLFSHRQDRGETDRRSGDYYVWRRLASLLDEPRYAWMAERRLCEMERGSAHSFFVPLPLLLEDQRLLLKPVIAEKPGDVELFSTESQIWRKRVGEVAMTIAADPGGHFFELTQGTWGGQVQADSVLSYHHGSTIIDAVKLRWGTGTGGFRPETMNRTDTNTVQLSYVDPGWDHLAHFRRPGRDTLRHIEVDQRGQMDVRWVEGALHLKVRVDGWSDIPMNLQFLIRGNHQLTCEGEHTTLSPGGVTYTTGQTVTISSGQGRGIRIEGLPPSTHRMMMPDSRTIVGHAERRCHRLVAALFTPVDLNLIITPIEL